MSEIVGARVREADGRRVGVVVDVRFVQSARGELRLEALLVSPRSSGSFLGYERTDENRPALIARYLRRRHRGAFLVRWRDVRRVGDGRVELRQGYSRWSPVLR
nr:PRC-barrel domain containing protein [Rhodococcus sp. 14C212]